MFTTEESMVSLAKRMRAFFDALVAQGFGEEEALAMAVAFLRGHGSK